MDNDLNKCIGNDNRYSFWCDYHEQRRFYGVCLWLKDAYENGRISASDPLCDCAKAMEDGRCAAIKMRKKEEGEGKVLFYTERTETENKVSDDKLRKTFGYKIGWNKVGTEIGKESGNIKLPYSGKTFERKVTNKHPKKESDVNVKDFSISSVINEQMKKEAQLKEKKEELRELKGKILSAMTTDRILARELLEKAKDLEKSIKSFV